MKRKRLNKPKATGPDSFGNSTNLRRRRLPKDDDRGPVMLAILGQKSWFKYGHLSYLEDAGRAYVEKQIDNCWLMMFAGEGYYDICVCGAKTDAERSVKKFRLHYPDMEVEYLERPDDQADHKGRRRLTVRRQDRDRVQSVRGEEPTTRKSLKRERSKAKADGDGGRRRLRR